MSQLVIGGTQPVGMGEGNRIEEYASELEKTSNEVSDYYTNLVKTAKDITELVSVLQELADKDLNIIGTRDYVYSSTKMLAIILEFRDMLARGYSINEYRLLLLTRSLGLRETLIRFLNETD